MTGPVSDTQTDASAVPSPMSEREREEAAVPEAGGGPQQKPWLVIVPGSTPLRQYARDVIHHRDLIRVLAGREIKLRYRQTVLGVSWVLLGPLLSAGILGFVFGKVANLSTDGVPFFVFSYAGLAAWGVYSSTTTKATSTYVSNSGLVSKIYFPRVILPLAGQASILLDFAVSLVVLLVLLFTTESATTTVDGVVQSGGSLVPGWEFLLLPVWLFLFICLAQGLGGVLGSLAVRYRDIPQVTPVIIQLLLYASPVAYAVQGNVPEEYQFWYYLNPLVSLFEGFRWSVFGTELPSFGHLAYSVTFCLVALVIGIITLERMEGRFADVI
jgi:lipopolysaccharide transport system permease protein